MNKILKLTEFYTPQAYKIENQRKYLFDNNILPFVIPVKTGIQFAQNFNRFPPARE